jgi:serine phosphatase RsbU (regulator of sigma subunit)
MTAPADPKPAADAGAGEGVAFSPDEAVPRDETAGEPWTVLIVDDEPDVHAITRMVLKGYRFKNRPLALLSADSAAAARAQLAARDDIAAILLDVVMETPDAGLALAREIREVMGNKRVRIILRTGDAGGSPEQDVIVNYDINDYKTKTELTKDKLIVTITTALRGYDDICVAESATGLRAAKEAAEAANVQLEHYRERVTLELELAQAMQRAIVPEPQQIAAIAARYGLAIETHFEPSSELGGDYWSLIELGPRYLGVLLADFSGHGVSAALNTFMLHSLVDRLSSDAARGASAAGIDPADWLARLNARLHGLLSGGQFAAAFFGVIDLAAGMLRFAAAGAPAPMIGDSGRSPVKLLDGSGPLLGPLPAPRFETRSAPLPVGGFLFVYSDALVESQCTTDGLTGEARLVALATRALARAPERPLAALLDDFLAVEPRPLRDDLTALWIRRTGPPEGAVAQYRRRLTDRR